MQNLNILQTKYSLFEGAYQLKLPIDIGIVIPENDAEYLCYEITAARGEERFLVYIDAVAGTERSLMQVIRDENGTLVM